MKKIVLFFLVLSTSSLLKAQEINNTWEFQESQSEYSLDGKIITLHSYELTNKSNEYIWLWFDKGEIYPEAKTFLNLFYKNIGDFSLMNIATDPNTTYYPPTPFYCFVKRIHPNESFTITLIATDMDSVERDTLEKALMQSLRIYPQSNIAKVIQGLEFVVSRNSKSVFYDSNTIVIPLELLSALLQEEE